MHVYSHFPVHQEVNCLRVHLALWISTTPCHQSNSRYLLCKISVKCHLQIMWGKHTYARIFYHMLWQAGRDEVTWSQPRPCYSRAKNICSTDTEQKKEEARVMAGFRKNGYPKNFIRAVTRRAELQTIPKPQSALTALPNAYQSHTYKESARC